ncbi:hypothetical protein MGN70_011454 [Eutypa lata]|nr:hypothetical protein MGN70_011454 [Eutypa lata]
MYVGPEVPRLGIIRFDIILIPTGRSIGGVHRHHHVRDVPKLRFPKLVVDDLLFRLLQNVSPGRENRTDTTLGDAFRIQRIILVFRSFKVGGG